MAAAPAPLPSPSLPPSGRGAAAAEAAAATGAGHAGPARRRSRESRSLLVAPAFSAALRLWRGVGRAAFKEKRGAGQWAGVQAQASLLTTAAALAIARPVVPVLSSHVLANTQVSDLGSNIPFSKCLLSSFK